VKYQTDVYRIYNKSKKLLYVGVSLNALSRYYDHLRTTKWAKESAYIKIQHFSSRDEALKEEKEAIRKEAPKFNITYNKRRWLYD